MRISMTSIINISLTKLLNSKRANVNSFCCRRFTIHHNKFQTCATTVQSNRNDLYVMKYRFQLPSRIHWWIKMSVVVAVYELFYAVDYKVTNEVSLMRQIQLKSATCSVFIAPVVNKKHSHCLSETKKTCNINSNDKCSTSHHPAAAAAARMTTTMTTMCCWRYYWARAFTLFSVATRPNICDSLQMARKKREIKAPKFA